MYQNFSSEFFIRIFHQNVRNKTIIGLKCSFLFRIVRFRSVRNKTIIGLKSITTVLKCVPKVRNKTIIGLKYKNSSHKLLSHYSLEIRL